MIIAEKIYSDWSADFFNEQQTDSQRYLLITFIATAIIAMLVMNVCSSVQIQLVIWGTSSSIQATAYCVPISIEAITTMTVLAITYVAAYLEQKNVDKSADTIFTLTDDTEVECEENYREEELENNLASSLAVESIPLEQDRAAIFTEINAPMPGRCISIVQVGDTVEISSVVCIIEAMKMQVMIRAQTKGIVTKTLVREEDTISNGQVLLHIQE